MKFEIKCRFTSKILFETESEDLSTAIEAAVKARAYLAGANLAGANLAGAYLAGAYLDGANLDGANLARANLAGANLAGANLARANLDDANLAGVDLDDANLVGASLAGANLARANLAGANLAGANLDDANLAGASLARANLAGANLDEIKKDFIRRLSKAKNELIGLYKSVLDGLIEGSSYSGECSCFVGTVAKIKGVAPEELKELIGLEKDSDSLTERWFLGIRKGDTPENNHVSKITQNWIEEFSKENRIILPKRTVNWE